MRVLTLLGVILNFSVRFHVAAAARLPFICTKTFPALALDLQVFGRSGVAASAQQAVANFFQTTIRIEIKM